MKLLTPKEVSEMLRVGKTTPYNLVNQGKLAGYKIGGSLRIAEEDLKEYLESRKLKATNKFKTIQS